MKSGHTTFVMLSLSCQLRHFTPISMYKSCPVASWDSKVSIRCVLQNCAGTSRSSEFRLLSYEYYEFKHTVLEVKVCDFECSHCISAVTFGFSDYCHLLVWRVISFNTGALCVSLSLAVVFAGWSSTIVWPVTKKVYNLTSRPASTRY